MNDFAHPPAQAWTANAPAWMQALSGPERDALALGQEAQPMDTLTGALADGQQLHWRLSDGSQLVAHRWAANNGPVAPPVVLLHGGSGAWSHWVRNIAALRDAGRTVWVLDLPGQGASDLPAGVRDADDVGRVLAHALPAWMASQADADCGVDVVGFSFGALSAAFMVACMAASGIASTDQPVSCAASQPALPIHRLVLVGAPGLGILPKPAYTLRGWQHLSDSSAQIAAHWHNLAALMVQDVGCIDRATLAAHIARVRRDRLPRRRLSNTDALARTLAAVSCPIYAIYGESDALYPDLLDAAEAKLAQCAGPHWRGMTRIAGAGHWVMHEAASAFNAALLTLLNSR